MTDLRAKMSLNGISAIAVLQESLTRFRAVDGVSEPLKTIPIALWLLTGSLVVAKALQYTLVLCNVATFLLLAQKLLRSYGAALLATALTLIAWQLRFPHDPTLGSSFQWPWNAELIMLSVYGIAMYAERAQRRWLAVAFVTAAFAVLSNGGLWPVVALLALFPLTILPGAKRLVVAAAFVVLATCASISDSHAALPSHLPPSSRSHYVASMVHQIVAPLPFTYRGFGNVAHDGPYDNSGDTRFDAIPDIDFVGWLATLAIALSAIVGLREAARNTPCRAATVAAVGAALWLGPAIALGPNAYWPKGVPLGQSLDGVYLEQFGVGLFGALLLIRLSRSASVHRSAFEVGIVLFIWLTAFGNVRTNAFAIAELGKHDYLRSIVERAGADHFFAAISDGSTVVLPRDSRLYDEVYGDVNDARATFYHYTGRTVSAKALDSIEAGGLLCRNAVGDCTPKNANVFVLGAAKPNSVQPQLFVAHWVATHDRAIMSDVGHGFAAFPDAAAADSAALLLRTAQPGVRFDVSGKIESAALAFTATRTCGPVSTDELFRPAVPTIAWESGFFAPPAQGAMPYYEAANAPTQGKIALFRWAAAHAKLLVRRPACAPHEVQVNFSIITSQPANVEVRWPGGRQRLRVGSEIRTPVELQIHASARSPMPIELTTNSLPFAEEPMLIRKNGQAPQDRRMLVISPTVTELLETPLNPELNPSGGLL